MCAESVCACGECVCVRRECVRAHTRSEQMTHRSRKRHGLRLGQELDLKPSCMTLSK